MTCNYFMQREKELLGFHPVQSVAASLDWLIFYQHIKSCQD